MSLDPMKERLVKINRRVAELDEAIAKAKVAEVIDLRGIAALRDAREGQWREMQGLVSSAIGA